MLNARQPGTRFRWAVIGPGRIAQTFAQSVSSLPNSELYGVWGRNPRSAEAFARTWSDGAHSAPIAFHSLESMLADPSVDAVYIATTHDSHSLFISACLRAGKAVLCEKPLVPTVAQADAIVALARQRGVFLMEALWTRHLPIYRQVGNWLATEAIGAVTGVQSNFCFDVPFDPTSRLFDPHLAGGALLDIGIYNLAMTRWVFETAPGCCPDPLQINVCGALSPTGVDQNVEATLLFEGGRYSQFRCAFDQPADNSLRIIGTHGSIVVHGSFWAATDATLRRTGSADWDAHAPVRINGFEEQIEEAERCVRGGLTESPLVPLDETLGLIRWIEVLRLQLGVQYPFT